MDDLQAERGISDKELWQWIPTGEFILPSATIQTTFKTRVQSILRLYKKNPSENIDGFSRPEKLEYLSSLILDHLVPPVKWKLHPQSH